jgi:ABC-type antimicrobial peptide transport system permease subunit
MTAAVAAAVGALVGRIAARVEGAPKHHAAIAAIAGFALALIMSLVAGPYSFRNFILAYMPFGAILTYGGLSFAAGIFLCLIGAGYPARVAAKMRPVEALRVEE